MTPTEEIRTAAAKLHGLVQALGDNRGPWYIVNEEARHYPQNISNIGVPYCVASTTTDPSHEPTPAQYICAMHPGVGAALFALLTAAAMAIEEGSMKPGSALHAYALATARKINYDHLQTQARRLDDDATASAHVINDQEQK